MLSHSTQRFQRARCLIVFGLLVFGFCDLVKAQQYDFETLQDAAMDPFVVELIGKDTIESYRKDQQRLAGVELKNEAESQANHIILALGQTLNEGLDRFASQKWNSSELPPFKPSEYLLALEKVKSIQSETSNERVRSYAALMLDRVRYVLSIDAVVYKTKWNSKQFMTVSSASGQQSAIIANGVFAIPLSAKGIVDKEVYASYETVAKALKAGADLPAQQAIAKKKASQWYRQNKAIFNLTIDSGSLAHRRKFFIAKIQSRMFTESKKKLIRISSQAKGAYNNANGGLKTTKYNSEKAVASATDNDLANAKSYMQSARESALEIGNAAGKLGEYAVQAEKLKRYMVPEFIVRTQVPNVGKMSVEELKTALANAKRGGNRNTVAHNTYSEVINVNEMIAKIKSYSEKANSLCEQIDGALESGEAATTKLIAGNAGIASSPFDVSSREAFELSKEKLSTVIPTDQYVAFTQAWVKLLQEAIKKDPLVMADDKKYLKFLRENFEGKTVKDIVGK